MSEERPQEVRPKREATIDRLREHYAVDELGMEEFERRVDAALRAPSAADLDALLSDLPAPKPPEALPQVAPAPESSGLVPPERVKEIGFSLAVLAGAGRRGRWAPPRRLLCAYFLGGAELDFRDALFVHPVTEVWIGAFLGGVNIIVPPGFAVEINGIPFLGGFACADDVGAGADPSSPLLKIRGAFFLGGAGVEMRYPGETEGDAKRRRRAERRARRKRLRG